jgi:hypothetical protein
MSLVIEHQVCWCSPFTSNYLTPVRKCRRIYIYRGQQGDLRQLEVNSKNLKGIQAAQSLTFKLPQLNFRQLYLQEPMVKQLSIYFLCKHLNSVSRKYVIMSQVSSG